MQYTFPNVPAFAIEGLTIGDRRTRPFDLNFAQQVSTLVLADASAAASEVQTINITDENDVVWSFPFTTGATVALSLAALLAAWRANGKANALASVASDGVDTLTITVRQGNVALAIAFVADSGSTMTGTHTVTTTAGGVGIEPARVVRRVGEKGFDALTATSVLADIAGWTFRTDGNVIHDREVAVDALRRGKTHSILGWGLICVRPETAVTSLSQPVYVRRALTSAAGTVGKVRSTPAGSTQVSTITVVADHQNYEVEFGYLGQRYQASYNPTDGTTTTDDVVDGLEDALAAVAPTGVTVSSASASATLTLTAAAGTSFDYVRVTSFGEDTEAVGGTVSTATADVDVIDISSIAQWESLGPADGLVKLRVKLIS